MLERAGNGLRDLTNYPHPTCRLVVNGTDITGRIIGGQVPRLISIELLQVDQPNESGANPLSHLGREHDAIATVKAGRLLFMPTNKATSASGLTLPHVTLTRADGDQHRFLQADRDAYTGVKAYYYDVNSTDKKEAIAGAGDNLKELCQSYTDQGRRPRRAEPPATRHSHAQLHLGQGPARADHRPDLQPHRIKAEITEIIWLGGNIRHSFTPDSYTTSLDLESQLPDGEDIASLAEQSGSYTDIVAWYRDAKTGKQHQLTEGD